MNTLDHIQMLEQELAHLRGLIKRLGNTLTEQAGVIKQLSEGPGDVVYIHPEDWAQLVDSLSPWELITYGATSGSDSILLSGKKYWITPHAPRKSETDRITKLEQRFEAQQTVVAALARRVQALEARPHVVVLPVINSQPLPMAQPGTVSTTGLINRIPYMGDPIPNGGMPGTGSMTGSGLSSGSSHTGLQSGQNRSEKW